MMNRRGVTILLQPHPAFLGGVETVDGEAGAVRGEAVTAVERLGAVVAREDPEVRGGVADRRLKERVRDAPAYLWVLSGNDRAQAFYRRHGFTPDGTRLPVDGLDTTKERWVRLEQNGDASSVHHDK